MLKKTISYEDYNGEKQAETFYFNLSKSELARMELEEATLKNDEASGGLRDRLNAIVASGSGKLIIETFEKIIEGSYGERSNDGKRFMKSKDIWNDFRFSPAYDVLFMELVTDANAAADFINAIVPADLEQMGVQAQARQKPQDHLKAVPKASKDEVTNEFPEPEKPVSEHTAKDVIDTVKKHQTVTKPSFEPTQEELEALRKMREEKNQD